MSEWRIARLTINTPWTGEEPRRLAQAVAARLAGRLLEAGTLPKAGTPGQALKVAIDPSGSADPLAEQVARAIAAKLR